jgi:hypothetical protein
MRNLFTSKFIHSILFCLLLLTLSTHAVHIHEQIDHSKDIDPAIKERIDYLANGIKGFWQGYYT